MSREFDASVVGRLGWRQGSILSQRLASQAWEQAPERLTPDSHSLLVLTSHDCDVLNPQLGNEPVVEVLRASVAPEGAAVAGMTLYGRSPRRLRLSHASSRGKAVALDFRVHDRWQIPRPLLMEESPADGLTQRNGRLVAEWLAKRYVRAAFPTAFDLRWRSRSRQWRKLLAKHSHWIQGVYLRLNPLSELPDASPYRCGVLLAVPHEAANRTDWSRRREAIERAFTEFWERFQPGIACEEVEVRPTDRITLADLELYQRFDADWISYEDDTPVVPLETDLRA